MTLSEQLVEANEIKALIKTAHTDNIKSGALLGYTTNNTKVTYEGATATYNLLKRVNAEIVTIEANIAQLGAIT